MVYASVRYWGCVVLCVYHANFAIRGNNILSLTAFRISQLLQFTWDWRNDEVVCGQQATEQQRSTLMYTVYCMVQQEDREGKSYSPTLVRDMAETYSGVLMIIGEMWTLKSIKINYYMYVHHADTQCGIFLWFEMKNCDSIKGLNQNLLIYCTYMVQQWQMNGLK